MSSSQKSDTFAPPPSPSLYYDDLDEDGNDRKLPPSLVSEFTYEPNILSEKLVQLQQFIHQHHGAVEYYIDRTIDGMFYTERKTLSLFRWLREDMPPLIVPSTQVAASAMIGYYANRLAPLSKRVFFSSSMGIMAGFLVFPSWRNVSMDFARRHLVEPLPVVQNAVTSTKQTYDGFVMRCVHAWDSYDQAVLTVKNKISDTRRRIVSFFKPTRPSP
jgi:hypothetical protein